LLSQFFHPYRARQNYEDKFVVQTEVRTPVDLKILELNLFGYGSIIKVICNTSAGMKNTTPFQEIAAEVQLFNNIEQKEKFVFVVGALVSRLISLQKGAEIIGLEPEVFLKLLEVMNIEFSYLTPQDIEIEKSW